MASNVSEALRAGTMAAARQLRDLKLLSARDVDHGSIDVFGIINELEIPLLVRPLKGLLGAFLKSPMPGILVTTERRLSIQRYTAAHELGHYLMKHQFSLDGEENIIRRGPVLNDARVGYQETEANAFAMALLMPRWLILGICQLQGWTKLDLARSEIVYQLSLRLGTSYEATCITLENYKLVPASTRHALTSVQPRKHKVDLLGNHQPADYRGDVWLLTEKDGGRKIDGSSDDLFVLRLPEHSSAGFIWTFDELQNSGFALINDHRSPPVDDAVGAITQRLVTACPIDGPRGQFALREVRPWSPEQPASQVDVAFDLTGPEPEGLSRAERRRLLEAS